jgi:hypothetical protein
MSAAGPGFDAAERAAIVAEWQRLAAEPPPTNPRPYGCATFLLAAALLLGVSALSRMTGYELPQPLGTILSGLLVLILTGGFVVGVFFGSGVYGRAAVRARAALDWLAAHPDAADSDERRRNAVQALYYAIVSEGPTTASTFDLAQAKEKLGASLVYVSAVEEVLVAELGGWRIFTHDAASPGAK